MDKVEKYRSYIQKLLTDYASLGPADEEVQTELIFDTERDHYQVVYNGWRNRIPKYGCVLHLDIRGDKIWIQHDGTEIDIANELVNLGVPKSDIVLAFHEPLLRPYTGFAVN
jgi:hypothetical protein